MRSRFLPIILVGLFIGFLIQTGCTKFDTTTLGTDLIPVVDNVNTFQTELSVNTTQGITQDSTSVGREDLHALGHISNDMLFGKTTANIFVQLKPINYPYVLSPGDGKQGLDSVVLTLSYKGVWGDSIPLQHLEVRKIEDPEFSNNPNTPRPVTYTPNYTTLLGATDVNILQLKNKKFIGKGRDSVTNQIRIRITDPTFINTLYSADTANPSLSNPAFRNDSLYRFLFNGLAILSTGSSGNGLMYINLAEPNTRLEIHYQVLKNGIRDTVYNSLRLAPTNGSLFPSATANNIIRDRTGFPVSTPSPIYNYLQTSPGTFINVDVPALSSFKDTNRIIHRAYLQIEEIPDAQDSLFTPPFFVYADLKDSTTGNLQYKPLYFDLNPNQLYNPDAATAYFPNIIDQSYFGGIPKFNSVTGAPRFVSYQLNLTRYLQRMLIQNSFNYQIRLSAPYTINYPQKGVDKFPLFNEIAYGRIRVGSGAHPTQRMKLVIIWTKLK